MGSVLVIPVFIPHSGCPHQCAFCNQKAITKETSLLPDTGRVAAVIRQYLAWKGTRTRVELAFFGGNFLGLSPCRIICLLEAVKSFVDSGDIQGIRFSTRPDTVTRDRLDLIRPYPVCLVELGVQTMNDHVLTRVNRGHTSHDTCRAISLLKDRGLGTGVQVMVGLPDETQDSMMRTAAILAGVKPLTARIYPVLVLKNTPLARWYEKGEYQPLTLDRAVEITCGMYHVFTRAGVAVIRMGLQTSGSHDPDVIAGPWHPAFGHLVFSRNMYRTVLKKIQALGDDKTPVRMTLSVHPHGESRLRGDKNNNLFRLKAAFPWCDFDISPDPATGPDQVDIFKSPA
jgi:histone acetyltransferase (RNA polymerase elongator complex component)